MRFARDLAIALVASLAIAGCGDSGEPDGEKLPASVSQDLLTELDGIDDRVAAGIGGACDDIFDNVPGGNFDEVDDALAQVPAAVDPEIRSALEKSVERLKELVDDECSQIQAREQDPEDEVVPEETDTVETAPEANDTAPPETETTPTTDTEQTPPPDDEGSGNGQGPDGTGPPGQDDGGGLEVPGGEE